MTAEVNETTVGLEIPQGISPYFQKCKRDWTGAISEYLSVSIPLTYTSFINVACLNVHLIVHILKVSFVHLQLSGYRMHFEVNYMVFGSWYCPFAFLRLWIRRFLNWYITSSFCPVSCFKNQLSDVCLIKQKQDCRTFFLIGNTCTTVFPSSDKDG